MEEHTILYSKVFCTVLVCMYVWYGPEVPTPDAQPEIYETTRVYYFVIQYINVQYDKIVLYCTSRDR